MKPRSYQLAIAIAVAIFIGLLTTSFSTSKALPRSAPRTADNTYYYFYTADEDTFQAYSNVATEIVRLQTIYGVLVDQNQFGGTLVAQGFGNNLHPHQTWPLVFMYAHF